MVDEEKLKAFRRSDLEITRFLRDNRLDNCLGVPDESIKILSELIPLLQAHLELAESFTDEEKRKIKTYGYHHVDPSFPSEGWE